MAVRSISSQGDFRLIRRFGKRFCILPPTPICSIVVLRNSSYTDVGLAIVVSRKIGKSVLRNKIKRRIRAIIRDLSCDMISEQCIITVHNGIIAHMKFSVLENEIKRCFPGQSGSF